MDRQSSYHIVRSLRTLRWTRSGGTQARPLRDRRARRIPKEPGGRSADIALVPHVRRANTEIFRLYERVRDGAQWITAKTVVVPLFRCELRAYTLVQGETGNPPVVRAKE